MLLLLLLPLAGGAEEPAWILLERGRDAFEQRRIAPAMDFILKSLEAEPEYPEAEYWLGRVYEAQGQPVLAEEQSGRFFPAGANCPEPQVCPDIDRRGH